MEINWTSIVNNLVEIATTFGLKLLAALAVLIIGVKLVKLLMRMIEKRGKLLQKLDSSARSFLLSALRILLYVIVFITVAYILGIPTTSFITILASAAAAIGLALQGSLSNLAGGIMILIFRPFSVGDFIETMGNSGTVRDISVFYTVIRTLDNKSVTLPNGSLTNNAIINHSKNGVIRVSRPVSVSYDTDLDAALSALVSVAESCPQVLDTPKKPWAHLEKHADSALELSVYVYCKFEDYWTVYYYLNENIKKKFDEQGIKIPFPQLDVHFDKEEKL